MAKETIEITATLSANATASRIDFHATEKENNLVRPSKVRSVDVSTLSPAQQVTVTAFQALVEELAAMPA